MRVEKRIAAPVKPAAKARPAVRAGRSRRPRPGRPAPASSREPPRRALRCGPPPSARQPLRRCDRRRSRRARRARRRRNGSSVLSLRVTRDRRGYDHIYIIEETRRRGRSDGRLCIGVVCPAACASAATRSTTRPDGVSSGPIPRLGFDWNSLSRTLASSLAAARWAARQQQDQRSGRPPGPPDRRSDRTGGRPRSGPRGGGRRWREDGMRRMTSRRLGGWVQRRVRTGDLPE